MKYAPELTQSLADLQTNPLALGSSLKQIVETPYTDVMTASNAFNDTVKNFITGIKSGAPASQDVSNGLQAATTLAGGALTPITTWFNVANKIPIVGDITKLLFNVPFSALGDASGDVGVGALKALPISDEAKANLEPGIRAVSTLAGQIIAGKYVAPDVMDMLSKHFGPEDAQTIVNKAQEVAAEAKANPNSPASKPQTSGNPDVSAEPNEEPATNNQPQTTPPSPTTDAKSSPDTIPAPKEPTESTAPAETTPSTSEPPPPNKTSGIAKSIEANAIAKGLTDKFENLAGFEGKNVKDQASKVADFITNNEAAARDAVTTQKLPDGMSPTMFLKGMEDFAMKTGDADLLQKLASSPITSESSVHAQELRFAGERDPESPVDKIKDVQSTRERNVQNKNGGKSVDVLRDKVAGDVTGEIKKASARPRDWGSFISSIEC